MANRIHPFTIVVPAGTTESAFQRTDLSFQDGRVDLLQVRIPPGPSGLAGFRIAHSGQSVIPYREDIWFVTDNDKLDWELEKYPTGDAWEFWAYNLDVYDHSFHVWFHVTDVDITSPFTVTPLSIVQEAPSEIEPLDLEEAP